MHYSQFSIEADELLHFSSIRGVEASYTVQSMSKLPFLQSIQSLNPPVTTLSFATHSLPFLHFSHMTRISTPNTLLTLTFLPLPLFSLSTLTFPHLFETQLHPSSSHVSYSYLQDNLCVETTLEQREQTSLGIKTAWECLNGWWIGGEVVAKIREKSGGLSIGSRLDLEARVKIPKSIERLKTILRSFRAENPSNSPIEHLSLHPTSEDLGFNPMHVLKPIACSTHQTFSFIFNPFMGHFHTHFHLPLSKILSFAASYNVNIFSLESDLSFGWCYDLVHWVLKGNVSMTEGVSIKMKLQLVEHIAMTWSMLIGRYPSAGIGLEYHS